MSKLFDSSWYRVAPLKPRIRSHAAFHRHVYRGEIWHVLQDRTSERFFRFAPEAYALIGLMDGERTMHEIWERGLELFGDDAPSQSETIRILSQLHTADVLVCDVTPDLAELLERYRRRRRQQRLQRIRSPLAIRIPLLDPERLLTVIDPLSRAVFSRTGFALWLVIVVAGAILAVSHWQELTENVTERALAPHNLLLLWFTFPVVKALHEIGHGMAVKRWGGEVHETGLMLLVLMPVPYVDASAATAFRSRWRRAVVGAAGMMTEVVIAACAMFVWLNVEPGLVRTTAYNVMLIAGVSTVLFNGNPLLRFDGYYILSDLLDIPNLHQRSSRYLGYLVQRYLFGLEHVEPPTFATGERPWFVAFGLASFVYRLFIYAFIILFIAGKFFVVGVLLACWAGLQMVVIPLVKSCRFVLTSSAVRPRRARAVAVTLGAAAAVAVGVGLVPMPHYSRAEGVVWVPERSIVRLEVDGFVDTLLAADGERVAAGQPLARLVDETLPAELAVLEGMLAEAELRRRAVKFEDRVQGEIAAERVRRLGARVARLRERQAALTVRAPIAGRLVLADAADLPGRFLRQGERIAYVIDDAPTLVRVLVPQRTVDLVRETVTGIEVRPAPVLERRIEARIVREVPAATDELPSLALGAPGGGALPVDPTARDGNRTLESLFQFDLEIGEQLGDCIGSRVYVRFDHGGTTLGARAYRAARQLLLGRFGV